MNKKLILIVTLILLSFSVFANNQGSAGSAGSFKAGVALGYPSGATAGWRVTDKFELNLLLGTKYYGFTVGVTPLFTLMDINIADQPLPLSVGPQVNLNVGGFGYTALDLLGVVRWEYSFKDIPLNLYVEGGAGVGISMYSSYSTSYFTGSAAIGGRYIFK